MRLRRRTSHLLFDPLRPGLPATYMATTLCYRKIMARIYIFTEQKTLHGYTGISKPFKAKFDYSRTFIYRARNIKIHLLQRMQCYLNPVL